MTPEETERKRRRNSLILAIFMLGILFIGTAGYAFLSSLSFSSSDDKSGPLINEEGKFGVETNNGIFYFRNTKETVANIPVDVTLTLNNYQNSFLYIDSGDNLQEYNEIATTLGGFTNRVQEACYGKCEKNLPEKDCSAMLIIINNTLENEVYQKDNCVFINGNIKAVDAFLYKILL